MMSLFPCSIFAALPQPAVASGYGGQQGSGQVRFVPAGNPDEYSDLFVPQAHNTVELLQWASICELRGHLKQWNNEAML